MSVDPVSCVGGYFRRQSVQDSVQGCHSRSKTRDDEVDAAEQRENLEYELGRGEGQEL